MIRFALSARTSTDDLQDPADSLRWQKDTAARLIATARRDRHHLPRHRQEQKPAVGSPARSLPDPA
jgi:hypothetical protein